MPRLSVNINDETAAALRQLAEEDDTSYTEVVRRAISAYKFLSDETRNGGTLQVVDRKTDERTTIALMK